MSATRSARSCSTERWAVAAALISLAATQVSAQPASSPVETTIKTPAEWPNRPELAEGIADQLAKTVALGDLDPRGGASAFVKVQTGAIYVTWLATAKAPESPETSIRAALDRLRAATDDIGPIKEIDYAERRIGQVIEAKRVWRDIDSETVSMTRTFAWKSPDSTLRLIRAECIFAEQDAETIAPVCDGALKTLSAKAIDSGAVGDLGAVPEPEARGQAEAGSDAGAAAPSSEGPSLQPVDPKQPRVLYQSDKKPEEGRSNLWLFIVGGVLIVFAFWAMRGRGESEREGDGDGDGGDGDERTDGEGDEGDGAAAPSEEEE